MTVHCFTSFTYSYLSRARILILTLRAAHPDWTIYALIVDDPPDTLKDISVLDDFDVVVTLEQLNIDDLQSWLFKHDIVEACTAVKGRMMEYLLEQGAEKVIYFDPDIAIFHPLDAVVSRLDTHSIILTPHQTEPNETEIAIQDNEITSLKYGVFNLGFVAVRNDETGRSFATWWRKQLYRACYDDTPQGLFTDQKYCDLVPALFDNLWVERDPGYNVASWNLSRRRLEFDDLGAMRVNGSTLKFYHFTKIGSAGDAMTERYALNLEVLEVWHWYKRMVMRCNVPGIPKGYWQYGTFRNGKMIPKAARELYRSRRDLMNHFKQPFDVAENSYFDWLRREAPGIFA